MHRHDTDRHDGEIQDYTVKLIQREKGLLYLSMREALLIEYQQNGTSMNDRLEKGRGSNLIRIQASSGIT